MENAVMEEILEQIKNTENNIVIDTTGSVIHTEEKITKMLKKHSLVIYIETSAENKGQMLKKYFEHPKPVIWQDNYQKQEGETETQGLINSYPRLLENREKLYKNLADITIPHSKVAGIDENNHFLKLIEKEL